MSSPPWPPAGDRSAQEFRVRDPWAMMLRANLRFLPLLVILFFIMTALGSLPFGGRLLPGLAVGAVVTAVMVLRLYAKGRRGFLSTVLRMSPAGVEWWDGHGFHVRLRWDQITRVGEVHTAMTKPGARVGVSGDVQLTVRAWENTGLIGWASSVCLSRSRLDQARARPGSAPPAYRRARGGIPLGGLDVG